jgi:ParB-like chromosome segregation protein Spo0J
LSSLPPLRPLHQDDRLSQAKLEQFRKVATSDLVASLAPGQRGALKARPDGTLIDGHHRIKILRERGVAVDALPREILPKDPGP